MANVQLIDLTKHYPGFIALNSLNLDVDRGELVALLGPSGCGKTTTLRLIAGLLNPSGGDILFDGKSVVRVAPERRGAVMVFQKHLLFPHMSVADNVAFGLKMRGVDKHVSRQRVGAMLGSVQLAGFENRRVHQLSGGQQQRVALARALVIGPQVLLLDEPLANLDANLRVEMRRLIHSVQRELQITTIFVTHDQEEAVTIADRVALIVDGELQQFDCPRSLYERPLSATVARFFRNENLLPGIKHGNQIETDWGLLHVSRDQSLADGPVLITVRPEHLRIVKNLAGNCVCAKVLGDVYVGSHIQVQVAIAAHTWTVNLPSDRPLLTGAQCVLHLPPEHIWLMPVA